MNVLKKIKINSMKLRSNNTYSLKYTKLYWKIVKKINKLVYAPLA